MARRKERPEWITIGVVTAPQGVRGVVRVLPLTDFPDRLLNLKRVFLLLGESRTERRVERASPHSRGLFLLKLEGIGDRNAAEALRGAEIQLPRGEAAPLPEGAFYVFDLVGCEVQLLSGERVGELVDVLTTAANDVYVVRRDEGGEVLIPAVRHVVKAIDIDAGKIVVDPIPGMLE